MSTGTRLVGTGAGALLKGAAAGALLGAVWGVFLRVWMRLLVVVGEFSWSGTLAIIGFAAAAGTGFGLVAAARRAGRRRWWRLAALLAAPLVLFPQGLTFLLPALVFGGLVVSGRPPRWLRVVFAGLAVAPMVLVAVLPEDGPLGMPLPIVLVILGTLLTLLAIAGAELFRRWPVAGPALAPAADSVAEGTAAPAAEIRVLG